MTLNNMIEYIEQYTTACKELCILQGEVLAKNFKVERIALQKEAFDEAERAGKRPGKHAASAWCPLNLFSRLHNGSLQICWQLVYRNRHTRAIGYKHLTIRRRRGMALRPARATSRELVLGGLLSRNARWFVHGFNNILLHDNSAYVIVQLYGY